MDRIALERRHALRLLTSAGALASGGAWAQSSPAWPQKAIRVVVPVAAGGIIDLLARAVGKALAPVWPNAPLVVESRPGADHLIGIQNVAHSEPDGYTWLAGSVPFTVNPSLRRDPGYNAATDFRPLALLATSPNALVVPSSLPAKTVAEFVELARRKPGGLTYANPGNGSSNHLGMELLKSEAKIDLVSVAYKGQPPAITDLLAGRVDAMMMSTSLTPQYVKSGQLRPLAAVAPQRVEGLPDTPTIKEAGFPGVDVVPWFGLLVPAKTPDAVVAIINAELGKALASEGLRKDIKGIGATPYPPNKPDVFAKLIHDDLAKWPGVLQRAGIGKS